MSDPAVAAQRQQQRQQGLIAGLVTLPFRFFGVLCGALLLCILIECVGMHFFWPEQGWRHAQGMLHYELDQLSTHFTRSALVQEPGRTAHRLVEQGYDLWTGSPQVLGERAARELALWATVTKGLTFQ